MIDAKDPYTNAAKVKCIPDTEDREDKPGDIDPGFSMWPKHLSERMWKFKDGRSYAALPVYLAILKHVIKCRTVYPSQETLARMTRLSRTTIYRALLHLEKIGLIQAERKDKSHTLNHYHLTKTLETPNKHVS